MRGWELTSDDFVAVSIQIINNADFSIFLSPPMVGGPDYSRCTCFSTHTLSLVTILRRLAIVLQIQRGVFLWETHMAVSPLPISRSACFFLSV